MFSNSTIPKGTVKLSEPNGETNSKEVIRKELSAIVCQVYPATINIMLVVTANAKLPTRLFSVKFTFRFPNFVPTNDAAVSAKPIMATEPTKIVSLDANRDAANIPSGKQISPIVFLRTP